MLAAGRRNQGQHGKWGLERDLPQEHSRVGAEEDSSCLKKGVYEPEIHISALYMYNTFSVPQIAMNGH
jgi:hypothetical protein